MNVDGNGQRIGAFKIVSIPRTGATGNEQIRYSGRRRLMLTALHRFQSEDFVVDDAAIDKKTTESTRHHHEIKAQLQYPIASSPLISDVGAWPSM